MTTKLDPVTAIRALQPESIAARLRQLMPEIEAKLGVGVTLKAVHQALAGSGIDIPLETLRTNVYRYRKKVKAARPVSYEADTTREPAPAPRRTPPTPADVTGHLKTSVSSGTEEKTAPTFEPRHPPPTPQELHALMHPDPVKQAEEIAYYERIGRARARKRRSGLQE
ncbi:putative TraD protein [Cupriavidus basilensis OR16]|uniref:Putative TraD protein n=1 Tax=Cupriavidus basilensis OR16 TaxID=1127483 RepID=H1RZX0_9BURK|nr:hypothetical protein [Cupriavidus basilensis]EHP44186.1 putative TraD protein [Cupriavidus basilensis OR16]